MADSRIVTIHYTLRDPQGRIIDTSVGGEPISYLEGAGQIIEGLDAHLRQFTAPAKTEVTVPAARAYGERDPAQVQKVPRAHLPIVGDIAPGDRFRAGDDPFAPIVTVVAIEGEDVLLDGNHPLAGVALTFAVEVVATRTPGPDDMAPTFE